MLKDDADKFIEVINFLRICFPERDVNGEVIKVYFNALEEYNIDEIAAAAKLYVKQGVRFPFVSEIVSIISRH